MTSDINLNTISIPVLSVQTGPIFTSKTEEQIVADFDAVYPGPIEVALSPIHETNYILAGLREVEADPEKWHQNLLAFLAGERFPFPDDVLDDLITEHDIAPTDPMTTHALKVLERLSA